jgi:hypothetical protein
MDASGSGTDLVSLVANDGPTSFFENDKALLVGRYAVIYTIIYAPAFLQISVANEHMDMCEF